MKCDCNAQSVIGYKSCSTGNNTSSVIGAPQTLVDDYVINCCSSWLYTFSSLTNSPFSPCYSIQPPRWLLSLPVWRNRGRIPDHPESQLLHPHAVPGRFWWRLAAVPADAQPGLRGPLARPRLQPHDTGRQHAHALALCGPGAANPRDRSGAGFVGEWDSDMLFFA